MFPSSKLNDVKQDSKEQFKITGSHTPLVTMPSRPPQPDLYFKLKKCIHIITLER